MANARTTSRSSRETTVSDGLYPLEGRLDPLVASAGDRIMLLRTLRDANHADAFLLAGSTGILDLEQVRASMESGLVPAGYARPTGPASTSWRITDAGIAAAAATDSLQPAHVVVRQETIRFDLDDRLDLPDVRLARQALAAFGHDLLAEVTDNATRELLAEAGRDRALMNEAPNMLAGVRMEVGDAIELVSDRWPDDTRSVVADVERSGFDVTWAARLVAHTSMAGQLGVTAQTIPASRPLLAETAKRLRVLADRLDPKSSNPDETAIVDR